MLSMSSDTLESSGSRELAPIDYGQSRSSTPDSSASSRLAAQLERSAYRRSRSNIRQRQNSSNINYLDVGTKKSSRNKRLKTQERVNRSYAQDEAEIFYTTSNGSFVVDGSQKSSTRRTLAPDEDQTILVSGNKSGMMSKSRSEQYLKEYQFNESEDGARILTARPIGTYTVSCVTVAEDNQNSLNYVAEDLSRRIDTVDAPSRRCQARGELQNGVYPEYRTNGLPQSKHNGRTGNDCHSVPRRNDSVGVSRVRFEESWEDTTTRKVEYKGRENSTIANNSRADKGLNLSKYRTNIDNSNIELKDKMNNSISHSVKHRQNEEKPRKVLVNTTLAVEDETGNRTDLKEDVCYRKNNATVKREVSSKPDHAVAQVASEILSRDDEPKALGLRQLIKIHEVQIAEIAKSAASMKRPSSGKFQEGRLVKVKVVPEIETKQTHMKLHAAKVSSPRNKTSFEENDSVMSSRNMPASRRSDVNDNIPDKISGGNGLHLNSDETFSHSRTIVKPKRHTVELRRTKSPMQEEQKWKRHTAIGLVGFDHQETRAPYNVNDWSPTRDRSNEVFTNDLEVEYLRKQRVEPEKQVVDEKVNKSDVIDVKTSKLNEISKALMSSDGYNETLETDEQNDVPPERPPLPKDFYSSTEDILERPPPPVADDTDMLPQVIQDATLNNEIMTPITTIKQQCDIPIFTSLPNFDVSSAVIQSKQEDVVQSANVEEDEDTVLGNPRTTREMYEERLARINLVPLDIPHSKLTSNQEMVSSHYTSLESFSRQNNFHLDKNAYLEKLKTSLKQVKQLKKEKEDLEKNFELKLRDWKRKYEEQQKVANAYQKLEDRYRRRVEDLQAALMQCRCSDTEARKTLLLGQSGKRSESYFLNIQTQSILDETENWLKEQSVHSEITHNLENLSNNARIPSGDSPHGSLSDITGGNEWAVNYKDFDLTTNIDQYNGTSV